MLVTKDDYRLHSGIDLDKELKKSNYDDETNAVNIFLNYWTEWCQDYLKVNYGWNGNFEDDEQLKYFKRGVMHQIDYVRMQGNVTINNEKQLNTLSRNALNSFSIAGLLHSGTSRKGGKLWWI